MLILGCVLIVAGFMGIRWFYKIFTGRWESYSLYEPIFAFLLIVLGIAGVFMVF